MMRYILCKKVIVSIFMFFLLFSISNAQALWEVGAKGGINFYLGDDNTAIFNELTPLYGGFVRVNSNCRFATKIQIASGNVNALFQQKYVDLSMQEEFNFFEYGLLNSEKWTRFFSPYIFVGVGMGLYKENEQLVYAPNIPFGLGVKYKVFPRVNIGLEWSMHKLFVDSFDNNDNPFGNGGSGIINKDWYSMATLMLSFDFGNRSSYCR